MKLKDITKEELELLSYTDLTYHFLKESKKPLNTPTIFRKICDLLGYGDNEYANKIGDYYTSLTLDRRFIFLDSAEWDLREHHSLDKILEDEDLVEEDTNIDDDGEEVIEESEDLDIVLEDEELDDDVDALEDLTIVSEDEIE